MPRRDQHAAIDGYRIVTGAAVGIALGLSIYAAVSVLPTPPPRPSPPPTAVPTPIGTALAPVWLQDLPAGMVWDGAIGTGRNPFPIEQIPDDALYNTIELRELKLIVPVKAGTIIRRSQLVPRNMD